MEGGRRNSTIWPAEARARYASLLTRAAEVVYVSPPGYAPAKMHARNAWMIDRADGVVALWDGSPGGTSNAVEYARRTGKPVENLWARWT